MKYIIVYPNAKPFYTDFFSPENSFVEGMIVINTFTIEVTFDGITWEEMYIDHL